MHVESAAISDIGYDLTVRRLLVTFIDGDRYAYERVPPEVSLAFLEAESKGRFFAERIRDRYRCRKL